MTVPIAWYERKQAPKLPWQTVYVSSDGSLRFPDEMATDHIVNILNKLIRDKQTELRLTALGSYGKMLNGKHLSDACEAQANDLKYLRLMIITEKPITAEMEAIVLHREEHLRACR